MAPTSDEQQPPASGPVMATPEMERVTEPMATPDKAGRRGSPALYAALVVLLAVAGLVATSLANRAFAPEMYDRQMPATIGKALARGDNYAVFDLNVNIREIRDAQLAHMKTRPDVILLGASHWQEAPAELMTDKVFFNSHIHRDYYEDILGMVEMLVRHDKLPRHLLISIRDNQFLPIAERTDFLWLPGIPYYRDMAARLGLEPHAAWQTLPTARWRELMSMQMLYGNAVRWFKADERPHPTREHQFDALDTLLPGGSIVWSARHAATYTEERTHTTTMAYVNARRNAPPTIDPIGVASIDRLFAFLAARGTDVVLVHPPFNPIAYDALKVTPYIDGLRRVEALTRDLAAQHGFRVIGSFDPHAVGCDASMYIDAEHSNASCLAKVLGQFSNRAPDSDTQSMNRAESTTVVLDLARHDPLPPPPMVVDQFAGPPIDLIPDASKGQLPLVETAHLQDPMPPAALTQTLDRTRPAR